MNLSNLSKSHSKETNQTQLWLQAHIYINQPFYMMFVKEQGGLVRLLKCGYLIISMVYINYLILVLLFYMDIIILFGGFQENSNVYEKRRQILKCRKYIYEGIIYIN